jgi:hypothetical protein
MEDTTNTSGSRISAEQSWKEEESRERREHWSPTGPLRARLWKNDCGPRLTLGSSFDLHDSLRFIARLVELLGEAQNENWV